MLFWQVHCNLVFDNRCTMKMRMSQQLSFSVLRSAIQDPVHSWAFLQWAIQDPVGSYHYFVARSSASSKFRQEYSINHDWRARIGVSNDDRRQTEQRWPSILNRLEEQGIRPGPESYLWWNDGDPALIQAVWCLVRRLEATKVVETGVAHGLTSRFILEALSMRCGHLWSIDLPPSWAPEKHREIGSAVLDRSNWSLILGSSRQRLPRLLKDVSPIDMFIHDSEHSASNMFFEMSLAWKALRPGGALVVDDIDQNWAFAEFAKQVKCERLVGEAEPIRPDQRRFNQKGLFGVLLKP
jgi:predicted O-methyltransferase YrrM